MTKKEFLDILNDIDDEFVNEFANAPQNKQVGGEFPTEDFDAPLKPQIVRLERPPKARVSFRREWLTGAAAVICVIAVSAFAFVRLSKQPQTVSPNDSGDAYLSDIPSDSEPISNDGSNAYLSDAPSESEPISSESVITDPKMPKIKRVEQDGYEFVLEVDERELTSPYSDPFIKTDSENEIAIYFDAGDASEELPLLVVFWLQKDIRDSNARPAASLRITSSGKQWHSITYSEKPEPGEKIVMQLYSKTMDHAFIRGRIIP